MLAARFAKAANRITKPRISHDCKDNIRGQDQGIECDTIQNCLFNASSNESSKRFAYVRILVTTNYARALIAVKTLSVSCLAA